MNKDSFAELLNGEIAEGNYLEDSYGEEVKVGDLYYIAKDGEIVHEKSLVEYALDVLDLIKKTR